MAAHGSVLAMLHELRLAFRTLWKSPAFTITTVLTLALAIGGNSAIFSVVNTVLLKPLPIDRGGRLVSVYGRNPQGQREYVAQANLDDWRAAARSFDGLASWVPQSVNLTGMERPERVVGNFVSANFLTLLGVTPAMGRGFAAGEDRTGGALVALISNGMWRSRFGGDSGIVGRKAQFNGELYTIVGVLPAGFVFPQVDADVLLPAWRYPNYTLDRGQTNCAAIGRLREGVDARAAQAEMDGIAARLAGAYPATNRGHGATVTPFRDDLFERRKPTVAALAGAVAFVLLIACANVAGLNIARIAGRRRELAVRVALGASRGDLFRQVLAEAVLLAGAGGVCGALLAAWAIPLIAASSAVFLPNGATVEWDAATVLFTVGISLAAAVFVAAIPQWQGGGLDALRGARGAGAGAARNRTRSLLVAGEMALALVLLAGAGLMVRSVEALGRAQTGFDPHNLMMMAYRVPRAKYATGAQQAAFHEQVIAKIKAVPGVVDACSVRAVPMGDNGSFSDFLMTDRPEPPAAERPRALLNFADPNFFATMRIPVLRGRVFTEHDQPGAPYVIAINQTLAKRFFADRDPIGQQLKISDVKQTAEIVAVVGDIKHFDIAEPPTPQIYGALAQNPFVFTSVAVRTAGDPPQFAEAVRRAAWEVDKDQPVWAVHTFDEILHNQRNGIHRIVTVTFEAYALMAVLLAAIGIFGLVSYSVSQRTGEIGVRVALGAGPGDVLKLILGQGMTLVVVGIGVGAAAAAWLSPYLKSQLYAVSPLDPPVYAAVAALLGAVALLACLLPARRALRVNPVDALRQE
jgi:putative ABC transport system permease protein